MTARPSVSSLSGASLDYRVNKRLAKRANIRSASALLRFPDTQGKGESNFHPMKSCQRCGRVLPIARR